MDQWSIVIPIWLVEATEPQQFSDLFKVAKLEYTGLYVCDGAEVGRGDSSVIIKTPGSYLPMQWDFHCMMHLLLIYYHLAKKLNWKEKV